MSAPRIESRERGTGSPDARPLLVIEQDELLPGSGRAASVPAAEGLPVRVARAWKGELDGIRAEDVAGVIALGGTMSAWEEERAPHLAVVRALLADAHAAGVPVLGVCLGAQMVARALGAEVRRAPAPEIGWLAVEPTPAAAGDALLGGLREPTRVYQWHQDVFELPAGAELLASSAAAPHQAFRAGARTWGVQFHPEADAETFDDWLACDPEACDRAGLDAAEFRASIAEDGPSAAFARGIFERFAAVVSARAARAPSG